MPVGTRSADRFEAACQRLRGKLLDAVAFQCFEQNPYVKSLQIRSKAGEALSAAASSGDILMLRLIDFVSPDVIEGPEGAAAVQAAMKAAECSDAWRRLSALAAAKWLLSRGAHLPQRSELAKGIVRQNGRQVHCAQVG